MALPGWPKRRQLKERGLGLDLGRRGSRFRVQHQPLRLDRRMDDVSDVRVKGGDCRVPDLGGRRRELKDEAWKQGRLRTAEWYRDGKCTGVKREGSDALLEFHNPDMQTIVDVSHLDKGSNQMSDHFISPSC